ncbi:hypothetical protein ACFO5Q_00960 [Kordiimonas lipolytica]|uniref:Flagellar protein FliL n=1 Tax=Kordiimonas lipolytica TaxID=1662421 RepID=A0ABV8U5F0_9PROT|nr:hypothetical protein [Kordiimonas lipolytica]
MRSLAVYFMLLFTLLGFAAQPLQAVQEEEQEAEELQEFGKPKIEMKPFNMALLERGRVRGKVTIYLVLVIEQSGGHEFVRTRLPQLRSDFNSALTVLARQRFSVSRPINPDIVKAYLTPYADRRLGAGVVSIYVKQALIEPD